MELMRRHSVQCVIDAGANVGAYARELREQGYLGRIISFEPQAAAFKLLKAKSDKDPMWDCFNCALGDNDGQTLNLTVARNSVSSSLLPMSTEMQSLFPEAAISHKESVNIRSLDSLLKQRSVQSDVILLKLDVQGYEDHVLAGASETLRRTVAIQVELAIQPLYDGSLSMTDMMQRMGARGYVLAAITPNTYHPVTGQLLEVDAIFVNAT